MKQLLHTTVFAFGLALGGGVVYGLYASEAARLLVTFLAGGLLVGGLVLGTALLVNRQWTRALQTTRPGLPGYPPAGYSPGLLREEMLPGPPAPAWPPDSPALLPSLRSPAVDDEVVA